MKFCAGNQFFAEFQRWDIYPRSTGRILCFHNAVWASARGGFRIVSDTLIVIMMRCMICKRHIAYRTIGLINEVDLAAATVAVAAAAEPDWPIWDQIGACWSRCVLLWGLDLIPEMWYGEIAEGSNDNQSTTAKSSCVAESDPRSNLEMLNHLECHVE